jgi:hypothetical protein
VLIYYFNLDAIMKKGPKEGGWDLNLFVALIQVHGFSIKDCNPGTHLELRCATTDKNRHKAKFVMYPGA